MAHPFQIHRGMWLLARDFQVSPEAILQRAGLAGAAIDTNTDQTVTAEQYFRCWEAFEAEANLPDLPIQVARAITAGEVLFPPLFAAFFSADFNTALTRMAAFKKLVGPLAVDYDIGPEGTVATYSCIAYPALPASFGAMELATIIELTRNATRTRIVPLRVEFAGPCPYPEIYANYFGVPVTGGDAFSYTLSPADARRPFLTSNETIWKMYEPHLQMQLAKLDANANTTDRVHALLMETMSSGNFSMVDIARQLGMGQRSLQRHLSDEGTSFQAVVADLRERLARQYLANTGLTGDDISSLLGYDKPSSFYRAFQRWTGTTPSSFRAVSGAPGAAADGAVVDAERAVPV